MMRRISIWFDGFLIAATSSALLLGFFYKLSLSVHGISILAFLSFLGLAPVAASAVKDLFDKRLSVDMLASIALAFSLFAAEWSSAAFITLMLAFARIFDHITSSRAKAVIQSLMKYHVERVRLSLDGAVKEVHISQVKPGDLVIIDAGDRAPVDGSVVSGSAEMDESSLTGESELVAKKSGDKVSTATVSESGSLIVRTERVGPDTTLARIIKLIEEASRDKNKAERAADRFTQWYIFISLVGSIALYAYGLSPSVVLSVLLVVCADDIAVAVPLAFTAAISRAARRGVIVKGSSAFEQISRIKYVLTDKTGTLTRGKPKVVGIRAYGVKEPGSHGIDGKAWTPQDVLLRAAFGASESHHAVSRAILEEAHAKGISSHVPDRFEEVSGQGVVFERAGESLALGRATLLEQKKCSIPEEVLRDALAEKDAGRGVVFLSSGRQCIGLISYKDELRPHAKSIIEETRAFGVTEWHMLTGDNARAAAAVAVELGIDPKHVHAEMTPEGKLDFVRRFEKEHGGVRQSSGVVAYIGDGVNDAASLALADVSIAMGGVGADAAIEAADVTIMKDDLGRLPEVMKISRKVRSVMRQNFAIWALTNGVGLALVSFGILGPAGAAAYNFLTDFLPIGNALRAGSK